jgi:hypothetical protein
MRALVLSCLAFVSLYSSAALGKRLPAALPADFTITESESAGMTPEWSSLSLSAKGGHYEHNIGTGDDANVTKVDFTVTTKELEDLYKVFHDNVSIHAPRAHKGRVPLDSGSYSFRLSFGGNDYEMESLSSGDGAKQARDALDALVATALAKSKISLPVILDASLVKELAHKTLSLSLSDQTITELPAPDASGEIKLSVPILPGSYGLLVTLSAEKSAHLTSSDIATSGRAHIEVSPTASVRVGYKSGALTIESTRP